MKVVVGTGPSGFNLPRHGLEAGKRVARLAPGARAVGAEMQALMAQRRYQRTSSST